MIDPTLENLLRQTESERDAVRTKLAQAAAILDELDWRDLESWKKYPGWSQIVSVKTDWLIRLKIALEGESAP